MQSHCSTPLGSQNKWSDRTTESDQGLNLIAAERPDPHSDSVVQSDQFLRETSGSDQWYRSRTDFIGPLYWFPRCKWSDSNINSGWIGAMRFRGSYIFANEKVFATMTEKLTMTPPFTQKVCRLNSVTERRKLVLWFSLTKSVNLFRYDVIYVPSPWQYTYRLIPPTERRNIIYNSLDSIFHFILLTTK